jgi:hypothetical protein
MNERILLVLLPLLLLGSIGAFFLYVPILPTIAVTVILVGLVTMFLLGVRVAQAYNLTIVSPQDDGQPESVPELSAHHPY